MELVSAIITTHKRRVETVKRAVESVVNQDYPNIEIIVVNDYPEDESLANEIKDMLNTFGCNIKYYSHKKNEGSSKARNTGLHNSKGVFIAYLDDDDEWLPNKISVQIQKMNEGVNLVYSSNFYVDEITGKETLYIPRNPQKEQLRELLKKNFVVSTSVVLLRRDDLIRLGGFDEDIASCEDYELWIRLLMSGKAICIEEPLLKYRISSDSTFRASNAKFIEGDLYIINKYKQLYNEHKNALMYHLNDMAFIGIFQMRDINMYLLYKRIAFSKYPLSKYNFFMVLIKLVNRFGKRSITITTT